MNDTSTENPPQGSGRHLWRAKHAASFASFCTFALALAANVPASAAPVDAVPVAGAASTAGASLSAATPAANAMMHLVIGLSGVKRAERNSFLQSQYTPGSPNFRKWLTPEQYGEKFGASPADVQAVVGYVQSQGFTVTKVWPNRSFISVDAPVSGVEAAFNVKILGFRRPAALIAHGEPATFYAATSSPAVAPAVAPKIAFVGGLDNLAMLHHGGEQKFAPMYPAASISGGTPFSGAVTGAQLSQIYNLDALHNQGAQGDGQTIAIFSPTKRYTSDVTTFASTYGYTGFAINDILVDGGPGDSSGSGEAALDGEVVLGQAHHATINYYSPPNSAQGLLDAYNKIATDNPSVLTSSWSLSETVIQTYGLQWYAQAYDDITAQMANQGISVFNDSGDWGAYNPSNLSEVTVQMQAASANVTGVGGTSLPDSNAGAWDAENPWSFDGAVGSGGGLSILFSRPWWQTGPGVANAQSNGFRQVPDVAALAWSPYYYIYANGFWGGWYGTSASTPLWASATLLMNQLAGFRLGNLNPALYDLGRNRAFAFHDITGGSNGVYSGTSGWDYITGWGSADFGRLYYDLAKPVDLAPFNPTGYLPGWNNVVMIHSDPGSVVEPAQFDDATTYYIDSSMANYGPGDMQSATVQIVVDGTPQTYNTPALPPFNFTWTGNLFPQQFTAGRHQISVIVNTSRAIWENNYSNNRFVRNITVVHVPRPSVTSITPNPIALGSADQTLTLTGADFASGATVYVNGTPLTPATVTATQITVSVPSSFFTTTKPLSIVVTEGAFSSAPYIVAINNAPVNIALATVPAVAVAGKPATLSATISDPTAGSAPTGTVTFKKGSTVLGASPLNAATASSAVAQLALPGGLSAGSTPITVVYSGDATFLTNTQTINVNATAAIVSTTTLTSTPVTAVASQAILLTVNVAGTTGGPTGTVLIMQGRGTLATLTLVNGVAYTALVLPVGTAAITANYQGDATYSPSTSPAVNITVSKCDTTTTVTSNAPSSPPGVAVTLTAHVAVNAPGVGTTGGSVQFFDGATSLATVRVDAGGNATYVTSALAAGVHTINANFLGTTSANASTGSTTQTIAKRNPTIAISGTTNVLFHQSSLLTFKVTGTGASPTGSVTVKDGSTTIATLTLAGGAATLNTNTLAVGNHTIGATYNGDSIFNPASAPTVQVTVNSNATTTSVGASATTIAHGTGITFNSTVTPAASGFGTPSGPVQFLEGSTLITSGNLNGSGVAGTRGTLLATGTHVIHAVYAGDTKFAGSQSGNITITVTP